MKQLVSNMYNLKENKGNLVFLPVLILAAFLLLTAFYLDMLHRQTLQQENRYQMINQLSVLSERIEGVINSNVFLIQGLVNSMSVEPDMSQERYRKLSAPLLATNSQLRNIAAAPDLVIRYMNPVEGNEAALGVDYRKLPDQLKSVKLARDTGKLIVAGPVNLVQGGQGFIVRAAVFTTDETSGEKLFWGILASVIDVERFLEAAQIKSFQDKNDIAIQRSRLIADNEQVFYGEPDVLARNPVLSDITLPYGSWTLAAVPKTGWAGASGDIYSFRLKVFMIGLLVLMPFIILSINIHRKRESDARLRLLFETSPVGIALNDYETGNFLEVNDALLKAFGYSEDEMLNLKYEDVTPEHYKNGMKDQFIEQADKQDPYEKDFIRKDGSIFPALLRSAAIEDASASKMVWSFIEDISDRKMAESVLQRSQKMDAIGQLTGGIAHDFNNILNVILGNLELLESMLGQQSDKVMKRITSIQSAGERAVVLTRQLLSFASKKSARSDVTNINLLIEKIDTLISKSVTPEVMIKLHLNENIWLTEFDQGEFEDTLLNLCINARDAMSSHGELVIETENVTITDDQKFKYPGSRPGEFVELSVADTGEGIAEVDLQHIFDPFFTTKDEGKGTGLGLSMVYGFVQRCGGFINVDSRVGEGTCFKLYFPRTSDRVLSAGSSTHKSAQLPGGTEMILLVDDEPELLTLVAEQLGYLGYQVVLAKDAQQAMIELERYSDIQLVLSDVVMPGEMNGYALADFVRAHYPHIKVLLASGYTGKARQGGLNKDNDILKKPFSQYELAARIRYELDHS